ELTLYLAIHVTGGHPVAELVGGAHPWRFHGDGYGAYQNEINAALGDAVETARPLVTAFNQLLATHPAREAYLVPGSAVSKLEADDPVQGTAINQMTLAILR